MELLIEVTTGYVALSFMDGYSGYNRTKTHPDDETMMAFQSPKGVLYYQVMRFGLENAGPTYTELRQSSLRNCLEVR